MKRGRGGGCVELQKMLSPGTISALSCFEGFSGRQGWEISEGLNRSKFGVLFGSDLQVLLHIGSG